MSARVYLTSGRWVDLPGMSVIEVLDAIASFHDAPAYDDWFLAPRGDGEPVRQAFRIRCAESVVAI